MRFSIQNIADWILEILFITKSIRDDDLHWQAANYFLTRDEIISSDNSLRAFSKRYDAAIEGLKQSGYVFHNEHDNVIVYSEIEKRDIRPLKIQVKEKSKIRCFYLAEFGIGCKIGITTNIKGRSTEYMKPWSRTIYSITIVECDDMAGLESHLKDCFVPWRMKGSTEFFNLSKSMIEKEILAFYPLAVFQSYEPERIKARAMEHSNVKIYK